MGKWAWLKYEMMKTKTKDKLTLIRAKITTTLVLTQLKVPLGPEVWYSIFLPFRK